MLPEPIAGTLDFKLHQVTEGRSVAVVGDVVFADLESIQIFERQVNSALGIVGGYVLPEIGQL